MPNSEINVEKNKQVVYETPEHVLNEWELLNLIISYTSIFYYDPDKDAKVIYFTTNEIKRYYNNVTFEDFDKIYGENGLQALLFFRNGIKYNPREDIWHLYPRPFLKYLQLEYIKDEEVYGKYFDKPCRNYDYLSHT